MNLSYKSSLTNKLIKALSGQNENYATITELNGVLSVTGNYKEESNTTGTTLVIETL